MPEMIFFTDNYQDRGTREGYQFEFFCKRCGNGYTSSFQHSVTGFGGRMLRLGGDLIGGTVGEKASEIGWDAEWMRDGTRGSTRDRDAGFGLAPGSGRRWPGRSPTTSGGRPAWTSC
jgi:hypothetical protein